MPCAKANSGRQLANKIKNRSKGLFLSINSELSCEATHVHAVKQHDEVAKKQVKVSRFKCAAKASFKTEGAGGEAAPLKWVKFALNLALPQTTVALLMKKKVLCLIVGQVCSCHYPRVGDPSPPQHLQYEPMHHHGGDALLLGYAKRHDRYLQPSFEWHTDSA